MRIRTIKPSFFMHDELAALPPLTRLLFIGLWCMADRRGRLEDRPKRVKAEILPYDECDPDAMLNELQAGGFVTRYVAQAIPIIQIGGFEEHQRITGKEAETESKLPDRLSISEGETLGKQPGNNRETSSNDDANCKSAQRPDIQGQRQGNTGETSETTGREGKGREGNEEGKGEKTASGIPEDDEVLAFGASWPGDMARGIPAVIETGWLLSWLDWSKTDRKNGFPLDWRASIPRKYAADWIAGKVSTSPAARAKAKPNGQQKPNLLRGQLPFHDEPVGGHL